MLISTFLTQLISLRGPKSWHPQSLSLQMHPMVHALPPPMVRTIPYNIFTPHITSHHIKHLIIIVNISEMHILYFICSGHGRQRIASSVSHCLINGPHTSRIEDAPPRPHPLGPLEIICRTRFAFISRMDPTPHGKKRPHPTSGPAPVLRSTRRTRIVFHHNSPTYLPVFYFYFILHLYETVCRHSSISKDSGDPYARKKRPVTRKNKQTHGESNVQNLSHNVKYEFGRFYVHHMYSLHYRYRGFFYYLFINFIKCVVRRAWLMLATPQTPKASFPA